MLLMAAVYCFGKLGEIVNDHQYPPNSILVRQYFWDNYTEQSQQNTHF